MSRALHYNVDNGRPARIVDRELAGLMREYRPRVAVLTETIGLDVAPIPGWTQVRDRSRPGRANVTLLVRDDCDLGRVRWIDCHQTWTRWEPPGTDAQHWPRSFVLARVGRFQVLGAHQPPMGTDNTHDAQLEQIDRLTSIMAPWHRAQAGTTSPDALSLMRTRPRLLLWDPNRHPAVTDEPGPALLAARIRGKAHGAATDGAVTRMVATVPDDKLAGSTEAYPRHAGGVQLRSDHGRAYVISLGTTPGSWEAR